MSDITYGDMAATLERATEMIRYLRDEHELIACSGGNDDICNAFDLVLNKLAALSLRFDEARSKESVMVNKMIKSSNDRHEVGGATAMTSKTRLYARTKATPTMRQGRWRPVARTRITSDATDCRGGGVPIGARIVIYADKPREHSCEGTYDFEWNVEERNTPNDKLSDRRREGASPAKGTTE